MDLSNSVMTGYKLGYLQTSAKITEVLVEIETLRGSKIIDQRQHEVYDHLKTDLIKIIRIEDLTGKPSSETTIYLCRKPQLQLEIKVGDICRFKHSDFEAGCFHFYTTKIGALNQSTTPTRDLTGVKFNYYPNGKIREKYYYVSGIKAITYGYYDNEFNSLHYCWTFESYASNQTFPIIKEWIYNAVESPVAQLIIHEGKIIHQTIYDPNLTIESIYLKN